MVALAERNRAGGQQTSAAGVGVLTRTIGDVRRGPHRYGVVHPRALVCGSARGARPSLGKGLCAMATALGDLRDGPKIPADACTRCPV
jgi:hypothetical protein